MADNTSGINALSSALNGVTRGASAAKAGKDSIGTTDFMNLLVAQLKNQDPLNPMDNQQFAVQLAQFSQLEQLVSINEKVGKTESGGSDFSSLASYLGHHVVTNSDNVNVVNNDGGAIVFKLPNTSNVEVRLLDSAGKVVESHPIGSLPGGEQSLRLTGLTTNSGNYKVEVVATSASGAQTKPQVFAGGVVSGVIPGADPKVIINGKEISTSAIKEVRLGYSS